MDLLDVSQRIGQAIFGEPVSVCGEVHRREWRTLEAVIDAVFAYIRGDQAHCLMSDAYDRDR